MPHNIMHAHRYFDYSLWGPSQRFYINETEYTHNNSFCVEWRMPKGPCHGYSPLRLVYHRHGDYWTAIFTNLLVDCCGAKVCLGNDDKPYSPHTPDKPNAGINNAIYDPNQKRFPSLILALLAGRKHIMINDKDPRVIALLEIEMPWRKKARLERESRYALSR